MTSVEAQVQALAAMSTAELAAEYARTVGRLPRRRNPHYLRKRIAHALQLAAFGGLPRVARAALDKLMAEIELPAPTTAPAAVAPQDGKLRPGSVLQRVWHGRTVRVEVVADGFLFDGEKFTSLSAVARKVTGQRWSGPLFFGLRERGKA